MSRLKITKGKAEVIEHSWSETSIYINDKTLLTLSIYDEATEDNQEPLECQMSANAELIADAFNTANETDKLPSELKQERDELMKLAKEISVYSNSKSLNKKAQELINKIENNE